MDNFRGRERPEQWKAGRKRESYRLRNRRRVVLTRENVIQEKSKRFAIRIIRLYQHLSQEKREFVLSKQLLRSGTSIGANVREAVQGFSRSDFRYKMSLALKESEETQYWLELLHETDYLSSKEFDSIYSDARELTKILTSILKTIQTESDSQGPDVKSNPIQNKV